jgi:hypothetical protein
MPYDERDDEWGRGRGRVYEGTPEAQRRGGSGASGGGVYPGTPERQGRESWRGSYGSDPDRGAYRDEPGRGDYGPLGWADVPGRPGPHVGKGPKGYQRSDERIREQVCESLEQHPDIDATEVEVTVAAGVVTLQGEVADRRAKRMSEDLVESLPGVKDVHNQLRIPGSPTRS